jgi:N-dimethylarginine dimethylaminohydrolase
MTAPLPTAAGVRSASAPLRRALLVRPTTTGDFAGAGWRQPDALALLREHDAFATLLAGLGVDVTVVDAPAGMVDGCFPYDPVFVTGSGQVVLRMAKPVRRDEPPFLASALRALGVHEVGALDGLATADGGDMCFLDERTLAVGRSYRTNAEAHRQLAALLAPEGVSVERFDLPHDLGPRHVLHLMSVLSPVAEDLAVVFEPLCPVTLLEALDARGIRRVRVDPDEYLTLASNVLPVRPGVVVLAAGNPRTARQLVDAGCEVHVYEADELSKGDGGPTCLTRPVLRG